VYRSNRRQHRRSNVRARASRCLRKSGVARLTYLLDTNACITHLRSKGKSKLSQRLRSISSADVTICSVVRAELRWGSMRSNNTGEFSRISQLKLDDWQ